MKKLPVIILFLLFIIPYKCNAECVSGDCVNGQGTKTLDDGAKYVGTFKDSKQNGQGTIAYADGRKYVGQWKEGNMTGQGTHHWPDGKKYVGQFKDGKLNGEGTYTWPNGQKYVGQYKNSKYDGQGTFIYANGTKYVGLWKDDMFNGQGVLTHNSGNKYVGELRDDKYNGKGILTFSDGTKYVGQWKAGKENGQGTYTYASGNKYVGGWKDGKKNGQGTYTHADGSEYVGQWKDNELDGHGTYTWFNGHKYVGQYKGGKKNGQGAFTMPVYYNGKTYTYDYVGHWKDDKENGQGTLVDYDGSKYIGMFKNGKQDGQGTLTYVDGTKYAVIYKAGKRISLRELNQNQGKTKLTKIDFGQYHALIIGNNNYRHIPKLRTAKNDAKSVATLLEKEYAFKVTYLEDASREQLLDSLTSFRRILSEKDNLLIYYAGHGYLDEDTSRGYWLPVDSKKDSRANWISTSDIIDTLKAIKAKQIMVVADSCFSGTLTRDARSIVRIQQQKKTDSYWAKMSRKKSRVVLTSGGLEPVSDGNGDHSVFNTYFRQALKDNSSVIDSASLYPAIKRLVMTDAQQSPEYGDIRFTDSDGGDFLFVRKLNIEK